MKCLEATDSNDGGRPLFEAISHRQRKEKTMRDYETCFGCGAPIRRGFPMVTDKGTEVIICEKCKRLWEKRRTKEAETTKGADDE